MTTADEYRGMAANCEDYAAQTTGRWRWRWKQQAYEYRRLAREAAAREGSRVDRPETP